MRSGFKGFMARFGTGMVVTGQDGEKNVRAFLQKSGSVAWEYVQKRFSQLGGVPAGRYVYIGPTSPAPQEGDTLTLGEKSYEVRQAETVMLGDEALYCWALCAERGGADTWGS